MLVSRLTSDVDSMSELVQFGLLQFVVGRVAARVHARAAAPDVGAAHAGLPRRAAGDRRRVRALPAALERRLPAGAGPGRPEPVGAAGVDRRRARHPGLRPGGRADPPLRRDEPRAVRRPHDLGPGVRPGTSASSSGSGVAATGAVVGVGGWLVHQGTVSVGTVAAFVLLLSSVFEPVQQLSQLFNSVQSAGAALHKLYDLLDTEPEVDEAAGAVDLPAERRPRGRRRHVLLRRRRATGAARRRRSPSPPASGWRWSARPVPASRPWPSSWPGSTTRRPAPSASAASTCGRPRWPRCASASSSCPRRASCSAAPSATTSAWRGPERPTRTSTPRCAPSARWEHFAAFPDGLDTEVRERGSRLSAGERQLVSLARAALVDPAVLVLDEATSNLDPGTEAAVEGAMERLMQGRTTIVVAHRLSTVRRADRIAVVDHGRPGRARHPRRAGRPAGRPLRRPRRRLGVHPTHPLSQPPWRPPPAAAPAAARSARCPRRRPLRPPQRPIWLHLQACTWSSGIRSWVCMLRARTIAVGAR